MHAHSKISREMEEMDAWTAISLLLNFINMTQLNAVIVRP